MEDRTNTLLAAPGAGTERKTRIRALRASKFASHVNRGQSDEAANICMFGRDGSVGSTARDMAALRLWLSRKGKAWPKSEGNSTSQ